MREVWATWGVGADFLLTGPFLVNTMLGKRLQMNNLKHNANQIKISSFKNKLRGRNEMIIMRI